MIFHWNVVKKEPLKLKLKLKLASITRALSKGSDLSSLYSTSNNSESESENLLQLSRHCHTLSQTKQVHAFALLLGLLPRSISLCASLILQYASFARPTASLLLFQRTLPHSRTAFLWDTLIRANSIATVSNGFTAYNAMVRAGVQPDECTYPFVLKGCSDFVELHKGKEVHGVVVKLGFHGDVFVGNTLLTFYGNCGLFRDAMKVFDEMPERDKDSWNTVIGLCSLHGVYDQARWFFRAMVAAVPPVEPDLCVAFNKMGGRRSIVSWNAMIANFAQNRLEFEAVELVRQMQAKGETPNNVTFTNLPACARLGFLNVGKEIHARIIWVGSALDLFVSNALTDMYSKCGCLNLALNVFNISVRDEVSYNVLIIGYSRTNDCSESLSFFSEMRFSGMSPDIVSFMGVIAACANLASIRQRQRDPRAGLMEEAADLIRGLSIEPDTNIWGALLGACRIHGNIELGPWAAEHLFKLKPQHCGYYILLSN
ncbi:putative pentatricopeptide repeat-containing protein, partial [Mucuna pruriens]